MEHQSLRICLILMVVLAIVVEASALLLPLGVLSGVGASLGLLTLLVQSDALVDLVQALLDFGGHWGWGGDMVTGGMESCLVGGVLHVDDLCVVRRK